MAIVIDPVAQTLPSGPTMTDIDSSAYNWTTGVRPLGLDRAGRIIGFDRTTRKLVVSVDDAATWGPLCDFVLPGGAVPQQIAHLADGEVVMCTGGGSYNSAPTGSQVWRSAGWSSSPASATFTMTHAMREGMGLDYGGFSAHGMVVTCSEYGAQNNKQELGNTSRFMWASVDGGKTFTEVFDLHTTVVDGDAGPLVTATEPQHLHGSTYDPWWDRLWIVHGDANQATGGYCGVTYCDNWRSASPTWHWVPETKQGTAHWQSLYPVPLKHSLAVGTDGDASGVRHVPRDGHRVMGPFQAAHILDGAPDIQLITFHTGTRPGHPDIALMAHASVLAPYAGSVAATFDGGKSWHTIYADSTDQGAPLNYKGVCFALGPTNTSRFVIWRNDNGLHEGGSRIVGSLATDAPKLPAASDPTPTTVWVPADRFTAQVGTSVRGYVGLAAVQPLPPVGTTRISASVQVPASWQSMAVDLVWTSGDTQTGIAVVEAGAVGRAIADGVQMFAPIESPVSVALDGSANGVQRISVRPGEVNVSGRSHITLTVRRLGDDAADTYSAAVWIAGMMLRRLT